MAYYPVSQKAWRMANKERILATQRAYRANNKERMNSYPRPKAVMYNRKYKYGLTEQQFYTLLMAQCGCCFLCSEIMDPPHVDHNHETGKVRGLLCRQCNAALGKFKDDPERLLNAVEYLRWAN